MRRWSYEAFGSIVSFVTDDLLGPTGDTKARPLITVGPTEDPGRLLALRRRTPESRA